MPRGPLWHGYWQAPGAIPDAPWWVKRPLIGGGGTSCGRGDGWSFEFRWRRGEVNVGAPGGAKLLPPVQGIPWEFSPSTTTLCIFRHPCVTAEEVIEVVDGTSPMPCPPPRPKQVCHLPDGSWVSVAWVSAAGPAGSRTVHWSDGRMSTWVEGKDSWVRGPICDGFGAPWAPVPMVESTP